MGHKVTAEVATDDSRVPSPAILPRNSENHVGQVLK